MAPPLEHRPDDREDAVRTRLKVYREQTAPLSEFYGAAGSCRPSTPGGSRPSRGRSASGRPSAVWCVRRNVIARARWDRATRLSSVVERGTVVTTAGHRRPPQTSSGRLFESGRPGPEVSDRSAIRSNWSFLIPPPPPLDGHGSRRWARQVRPTFVPNALHSDHRPGRGPDGGPGAVALAPHVPLAGAGVSAPTAAPGVTSLASVSPPLVNPLTTHVAGVTTPALGEGPGGAWVQRPSILATQRRPGSGPRSRRRGRPDPDPARHRLPRDGRGPGAWCLAVVRPRRVGGGEVLHDRRRPPPLHLLRRAVAERQPRRLLRQRSSAGGIRGLHDL